MNKTLLSVFVVSGCVAHAQMGRTLDWPTYAGDAQRTGWEKSDSKFTKDDVAKGFQFLWKLKPDSPQKGPRTVMAPVIVGNLIGYRGFKELAFITGSDDSMHVMDADLNRMYWERRFERAASPSAAANCPGGLTAMPTLMAIGFRRPTPRPTAPGAPAARPAPNPMFGPRAIYVIASGGKLHRVNVANGEDAVPAVSVLPANAHTSTLNMNDNTIYATTGGCGSAPNTVWAVDISDADPQAHPKVASYVSKGRGFVGLGGPVIGNDGTIYAQSSDGLLALTPKTLELKGHSDIPAAAVSPVVFAYKEKDVVVTAGADGRLYLIDSASLETISKSEPVAASGNGLWGGLSSWEDTDGTRWVLATVWGAPHAGLKIPQANGEAKNGSIVAFKLSEQDGKPVLTPAWSSRDMAKPAPPVIANGVVFALANGGAHATLYALDGVTGKEMWSTGDKVTAPGNLTGVTIANGRVYFATNDNTVWVFGMPLEW